MDGPTSGAGGTEDIGELERGAHASGSGVRLIGDDDPQFVERTDHGTRCAVAVSGERLRNIAKRPTSRMYLCCVAGDRRMFISSVRPRRSGLIAAVRMVSSIGWLLLVERSPNAQPAPTDPIGSAGPPQRHEGTKMRFVPSFLRVFVVNLMLSRRDGSVRTSAVWYYSFTNTTALPSREVGSFIHPNQTLS